MHMGGAIAGAASLGGGAGWGTPGLGALPPPLLPELPPPELPPPEHTPLTVGLQMKPAPQSESALHGSCHWYAQILVVVVVHISSIFTGGPASQGVLGGQAATVAPPEQAVVVCAKQTMPAPQSASPAHIFGSQLMTTVVVAEASGFGHSAPGRQSGWLGLTTVDAWQVKPCGQSLSWAQVCAEAVVPLARISAVAATPQNDFNMLVGPFRSVR
jgi:hypothetical protein